MRSLVRHFALVSVRQKLASVKQGATSQQQQKSFKRCLLAFKIKQCGLDIITLLNR